MSLMVENIAEKIHIAYLEVGQRAFKQKITQNRHKISHKKSAIARYSTIELSYCLAKNADQWQISQTVMHRVEPKKLTK
jgi:hypothetical protein